MGMPTRSGCVIRYTWVLQHHRQIDFVVAANGSLCRRRSRLQGRDLNLGRDVVPSIFQREEW